MSITDELREYADKLNESAARKSEHGFSFIPMRLERIADRIDAEADDNERFRRDVEPFCDRLREAAAERADVTLYDVDYVALPVDADGEPIRVGDAMDKGEVTCISDCGKGWEVVLNNLYTYDTPSLHHHKPTVEEVMQEMLEQAVDYSDAHTTVALNAIAEYADRIKEAVRDE